jgi:hypothetical protein
LSLGGLCLIAMVVLYIRTLGSRYEIEDGVVAALDE